MGDARARGYDVIFLQEHRLGPVKAQYQFGRIKKSYHHAMYSCAPIKNHDTSGGSCVLVNKRHNIIPRRIIAQFGLDFPKTGNWSVAYVRKKNVTFALISLYLVPEESSINSKTLNEIEVLINKLACPWMVYGDFNRPHQQVLAMRWGPAEKGHLVRPQDTDVTCLKGQGSMIDYGYVSPSMGCIYHGGHTDPAVPFKTHLAAVHYFEVDLRETQTWQMVKSGTCLI